MPEPLLIKLVGPYSLQHEGGSEIDVKVTSVKILDGKVKLSQDASKCVCNWKYLPCPSLKTLWDTIKK